ncbi:hypothetical protein GCM10009114_12000 [Aliiglaciecola litoralis]|uniref:Uncharacterized protein n=1 Tax=Aliiglaciecola litoralis TaxID=582857 RepID=A0ABP3WPZ1_9ALTE
MSKGKKKVKYRKKVGYGAKQVHRFINRLYFTTLSIQKGPSLNTNDCGLKDKNLCLMLAYT